MATRAKLLTELLKNNRSFEWKVNQQASFEKLRDCLCEESMSQCPNFFEPFIVTTDASNLELGAILSQGKLGEDLLIAFISRVLNSAEINYSVSEKQGLAVVFFTKHLRHYLYGRKLQW